MAAAVEGKTAEVEQRNLSPWELRALEQECACLMSLGKIAELEQLLARSLQPCVRYHLALAYALNNNIDPAVEQLRAAMKQKPDYPSLKALAFHVAVRQADLKLKEQDWNAISSAVALALEAGPPDAEGARELLRFKSALPISHIKAGNRLKAAEIWEAELRSQPSSRALIHNLAILYYWGALQEESTGGRDAGTLWTAAIAYWNLIVNSEEFWSGWRAELEERWGFKLEDADLQPVRETFLSDRLIKHFQDQTSSFKEQDRQADAARHEDYLAAAFLEKKSAEAWKPFAGDGPAGGFLYYQRQGSLNEVLARINRLPNADAQQQKLRLYFSPDGLGKILTLIEEQRLPEKALARLASLPDKLRADSDARYLRVLALYESAREFEKRRASSDVLRQVEAAWTEAQSQPAGVLLTPLKEHVADLLSSAARQEATRLKKENKLDEAVPMLERMYSICKHLGIREYLCILYHDRGMQKVNEKQWAQAREHFQKALDLDKNYMRAKQSMSLAYNNEAMASEDKELALKLLQQALQYEPDDPVVRENLGYAFNGKAVRILNAANQYNVAKECERAIGLLRAAVQTVKPDLEQKVLDNYIARGGQGFEEEVNKLPEGAYRLIMQNLAIAAQRRNQVRR